MMKFLILCLVIFASNQGVRASAYAYTDPVARNADKGTTIDFRPGNCEVTEEALAELSELRRIVGQLATLVETLIGEPVISVTNEERPCEYRDAPLAHLEEVRIDECTTCTCNDGTVSCDLACPEVASNEDERPCAYEGKPLAHLEELRIDECTLCTCTNGTIACDIACPEEGTEEEPVDELIDATLSYTWKEATVSWVAPDQEVVGYSAKVISADGEDSSRLSPFETSFTTTGISPNQNYTIEITPIMTDGPGTKYSTEVFKPVCPAICTFIYAPVCATDGNTYSNLCAFEIAQCETGDETLDIDYPGACDPCRGVQCGVPICPDGFVMAQELTPGDCCLGCVDECDIIVCDVPQCGDGYLAALFEGECCEGCIQQVFEDCSDAQASGMAHNGVYLIQPIGVDAPFEVFCDLQNEGGRWTVIVRRVESPTNFLRDYDEYVEGFGDAGDAYWIGLENLYRLNKQGNTRMIIKGTDFLGASATGNYNIFRVGAAADNYALETIVGFRGDIGNALAYNKGAAFSAPDQDNDNDPRDCAGALNGGWWHKGSICSRANPLGEFLTPDEFALEKGIFWAPFRGKGKSLQYLEMRIRPV